MFAVDLSRITYPHHLILEHFFFAWTCIDRNNTINSISPWDVWKEIVATVFVSGLVSAEEENRGHWEKQKTWQTFVWQLRQLFPSQIHRPGFSGWFGSPQLDNRRMIANALFALFFSMYILKIFVEANRSTESECLRAGIVRHRGWLD